MADGQLAVTHQSLFLLHIRDRLVSFLLAATGRDMLGGLCLRISVCRACMFGMSLDLDLHQMHNMSQPLQGALWRHGGEMVILVLNLPHIL